MIAATTAIVGGVVIFAVAPMFMTFASAAISCQNPAGNEPAGQQGKDKCQGPALANVNPAGHAPPGQND